MILKVRFWLFLFLVILILSILVSPEKVLAQPQPQQGITSAAQLIDAVNGLRLAYGLRPLAVHSILMQTAQGQADYMASIGQWTHSRPGGMTYTQQLLSLGFPLAGDLSLGGFRAENVLMQTDPLVWTGVPPGWQDADHMNTMLSQNFTHIGAGVSQGSDGYYYAVDAAAVTGSGQMQSDSSAILTTVPGTGVAGQDSISQYMVPVVKSTARPDGDVLHKVQYGQTLWSIAIEYGTTIRNIQALNNLGDDLIIYQGQELIVMKGATQPPPATLTPVPPSAVIPNLTMAPTASPTFAFPTIAFPPTSTIASSQDGTYSGQPPSNLLVVVLILAAFVGAGMAVWLIRDPRS
jgi:LysM repeat protein